MRRRTSRCVVRDIMFIVSGRKTCCFESSCLHRASVLIKTLYYPTNAQYIICRYNSNYKIFKSAPTCFRSQMFHHQGALYSAWLKITRILVIFSQARSAKRQKKVQTNILKNVRPDHYCICTVHVIRSLNCQYQHMHNFNVTG